MKFDHAAINVRDLQRSINWYSRVFKAEVLHQDETWVMLKIGDSKLALFHESMHPPHFAFTVDSVMDIPSNDLAVHRDSSIYSYIEDPDGNTLEVLCYPKIL
tara:strand:+ start:10 stop:315 length:306 start_codon:yes stop_codon:yes gene_type:complete